MIDGSPIDHKTCDEGSWGENTVFEAEQRETFVRDSVDALHTYCFADRVIKGFEMPGGEVCISNFEVAGR